MTNIFNSFLLAAYFGLLSFINSSSFDRLRAQHQKMKQPQAHQNWFLLNWTKL